LKKIFITHGQDNMGKVSRQGHSPKSTVEVM